MAKKLLAVLAAALLVAAFCLYALMQKDDANDRSFVVRREERALAPIETVSTADGAALARAFGEAVPLPSAVFAGSVFSDTYAAQAVRRVTAQGDRVEVSGVTPLSAAPLVRDGDLAFVPGDLTLFGYPLLSSRSNGRYLFYLLTENAAFELSVLAPDADSALEALSALHLQTND